MKIIQPLHCHFVSPHSGILISHGIRIIQISRGKTKTSDIFALELKLYLKVNSLNVSHFQSKGVSIKQSSPTFPLRYCYSVFLSRFISQTTPGLLLLSFEHCWLLAPKVLLDYIRPIITIPSNAIHLIHKASLTLFTWGVGGRSALTLRKHVYP